MTKLLTAAAVAIALFAAALGATTTSAEAFPNTICGATLPAIAVDDHSSAKMIWKVARQVESWTPLTGACRTSSGGQGQFTLFRSVGSRDKCRQRCFTTQNRACTAFEYSEQTRGCEIHWQPITHSSGRSDTGTVCYILRK